MRLQRHTHDVRAMSACAPTADLSLHRGEPPLRGQSRLAGRALAEAIDIVRGRSMSYSATAASMRTVSVAVATSKLASKRIGKTLTFTLIKDLSWKSRARALTDFERSA